ncbi:MAG: hypothetical protein AB7F88_07175 [Pyrinomonadaceae bacterium]
MGMIAIEIPSRLRRRYRLDDETLADEILAMLEASSAVRLKALKLLTIEEREVLEDFHDGRAADKAMEEYERTGISYSMEEVKAEFGL